MDRLLKWLKEEPSLFNIVLYIIITVVAMSIYAVFYTTVIAPIFGYSISFKVLSQSDLILVLIVAPLVEELKFRALCLGVFIHLYGVSKYIFLVVLFTSVIFGYAHGGAIGICFQGVSGILLCFLFLKCGGFQKKYIQAFIVVFITHSLYNFFNFLMQSYLNQSW